MFYKNEAEIMKNWGLYSSPSPQKLEPNPPKALCSFICLTYNHASYIEECLHGFLEQETSFPFEILIHDDCSTDGTDEIIKAYADKYPNIIKPFYEKENQYSQGKVIEFYDRLHKNAGKYVAFCEGDDYWDDPKKIETQVRFLESNPDFVACYHECLQPDDKGQTFLYDKLEKDKESEAITLQRREVFMSLRTLCHRNVIDYSDPLIARYASRIFNGDVFVNALLGAHGKVKYLSSIAPAYYRFHQGGVYSSLDEEDRIANIIRTLYYIGAYHSREGDQDLASVWLRESIFSLIDQKQIGLSHDDNLYLARALFYKQGLRLPLKLALIMAFPTPYYLVRRLRDGLRRLRSSFQIKTDIKDIYYREFEREGIPRNLKNFFARKLRRFKDKRFNKHRLSALNATIEAFIKAGALGVCKQESKFARPRLVVSLTSYPKRICQIHYTIYSLLSQSYKPDKLVLWLSKEEFPNGLDSLPAILLRLQRYGLDIRWCEGNLKSYKKIIPSLEVFKEAVIVIADDDALYAPDWLEKLATAYEKDPTSIHCHWAGLVSLDSNLALRPYSEWGNVSNLGDGRLRPSFLHMATGIGGVLYPPNSLHEDVLDSKTFMRLCPLGDDLWLWALALLKGTKINIVPNNRDKIVITDWGTQDDALWRINCDGGYNDSQLQNLLAHYPKLQTILEAAIAEANNLDVGGGGGGIPAEFGTPNHAHKPKQKAPTHPS